jgi:Flp pilus assembly protein CpaB
VRRRSNLLVLLGVAFFVIGGVIVYLVTNDSDDGGAQAAVSGPVTVVVPTEDIPAGSLADDLIEAGRLKEAKIQPSQLSPGAVQSVNQLAGATFIQGFAADQQITTSGLQLQNRTFEVPEGFEAVAVQLDFVPGGAGYVNPGDRINLYGLYSTPLGDRAAPRAELLLTNVEVLDVDLSIPPRRGSTTATDPSTSGTPRASTSTVTYLLAMKADDAEKAIFTSEFASFYASLTAKDAPPAGPTPGRDGETILAEEPNVAFNG